MSDNQAVLGYLGRALSFELSAVQQYLSLAAMMDVRGMKASGEKFRQEANEEMGHVERIIARMLALGAAPSASQLRATQLDGDLPELMLRAKKFEQEIVNFYSQAVRHCAANQDHENRVFFEAILKEEQEHVEMFESWWRETTQGS